MILLLLLQCYLVTYADQIGSPGLHKVNPLSTLLLGFLQAQLWLPRWILLSLGHATFSSLIPFPGIPVTSSDQRSTYVFWKPKWPTSLVLLLLQRWTLVSASSFSSNTPATPEGEALLPPQPQECLPFFKHPFSAVLHLCTCPNPTSSRLKQSGEVRVPGLIFLGTSKSTLSNSAMHI